MLIGIYKIDNGYGYAIKIKQHWKPRAGFSAYFLESDGLCAEEVWGNSVESALNSLLLKVEYDLETKLKTIRVNEEFVALNPNSLLKGYRCPISSHEDPRVRSRNYEAIIESIKFFIENNEVNNNNAYLNKEE